MPAALVVAARCQQSGRGVVDADECEHQPGRIVGGKLGVEHDLLGHAHATAPLRRPVRHGVTRGMQLAEPPLLEAREFFVVDAGLGRAPVRRDVFGAPVPHGGAKVVEISALRHAYNPLSPDRPARRVNSSRVADNPSGSLRSGWL